MKKFLAVLLVALMLLSIVACGEKADESKDTANTGDTNYPVETGDMTEKSDLKIGVILVGDENEGYTYAHIEGIKKAAADLGIADDQIIWKYKVGEDETCHDAALELVDAGCNAIFSNSYGHQSFMKQAAEETPDVQFVALTGDTAASSGLTNFSNAFTGVYESRYVSGVVAGMKIAELVKDGKLTKDNYDADGNVKIGYIGAYPYAEVVSGYTAFFLGVKSVYEKVVMEVTYTNSWFSITAEATAGEALAAKGCVVIGQHADSTGAPAAIQALYDKGQVVYSIGYNVDMHSVAPKACLTSATNNWSVYYEYAFNALLGGEKIATNWSEGYKTGAVAITELGSEVAEGTADKVAEVETAIKDGSLKVFDTSKFTVGGEVLTSYLADVVPDEAYTGDTEAIADGYFHESEYRSAPYFAIRIDGITEDN